LAQTAPRQTSNNAALRYWQAFAHTPELNEERQKSLAAALAPDGKLSDEHVKLLEESRDALLYLRRGAALKECDWGLHYEDGPYLLLPQLVRSRNLGRLAALRTRHRIEQVDGKGAVEDTLDALTLARHAGADGTMVSYLVQLAIEQVAMESLAAGMAGLDPAALDAVAKRLESLPPGGSLVATTRTEKESFFDWARTRLRAMKDDEPWQETILKPLGDQSGALEQAIQTAGGTRQGVLEQLDAFAPYYGEVAKILPLPRDQFLARHKELRAGVDKNPIGKLIVPAYEMAYERDQAGRTRMTMLKAALAAVRQGPDAVKAFKDAAGNPIEYRKTDAGFELRSPLTDRENKPVVLRVGKGRQNAE
jgi:hypothetical protein